MRVTLLALSLILSSSALAAAPAPTEDQRIEALLKKMTLEEKLGQLFQLAFPEERVKELAAKGQLGSVLTWTGPKKLNEVQRLAVEKSRLGIPLLFGHDIIHGYRTMFPIPLAMAASWDPALVEKAARHAAREAHDRGGLRWTFSPMVDVARDPRWGRIAEGAGEDPYLGAAMARAYVRGYQGDDPSKPGFVAATAKHWVGYGAAEGGRDYNTTELSERTLREIYFPPFKAAVDAGALTLMSAFNDISGVPASGNAFTLTKVLRDEWKFRGFVVSDWGSVTQLADHGVAKDDAEAAALALSAGVDMEMVTDSYIKELPKLIAAGKFPLKTVDEAVRRVLRVKLRVGLFERPYAAEDIDDGPPKPEDRALAREAATRSLVLLKNDGTLPFKRELASLAVIGPIADDADAMLSSWRAYGQPQEAVSVLAGLKAALPKTAIYHVAGGSATFGADADIARAVAAASKAEAVVLVVGENGDMSGEARSRASIDLPGRQAELALAVLALGKPTAVVLMAGRAITLREVAEKAPALLLAWHGGTEGGTAVADVLLGAEPGGRLPITFPRSLGQIPLSYNYKNTGRPFVSMDNIYTSRYIDESNAPLYPFGHGLSYTSFELSDVSVDKAEIRAGGSAVVSAAVKNVGARAGGETVQLYIRRRAASVSRPVRELKGFRRVTLAPGESRVVSFKLGPDELGLWGRDMRWSVEPGEVQVFVSSSAAGGLPGKFAVVR